nr:AMP-binding protein [Rhizobium sp. FKY42]
MQAKGVGPGSVVGLYLKRSLPMVVGIVAAMKLGAAYAPQHVGVAPDEILTRVAAVSGAPVVLTMRDCFGALPSFETVNVLVIEDVLEAEALTAVPDAALRPKPEDRCILLFTSGTTGQPNGVQVTHGNLANVLFTAPGDLGICPGRKVGQILSIAFDMAAWETLGALGTGPRWSFAVPAFFHFPRFRSPPPRGKLDKRLLLSMAKDHIEAQASELHG